jgi:hypothetical protein
MTDPNAIRMKRKYKGFTNAIKLMLNQEYKFMGGERIQDMFIQDLMTEYNKHLKDGWKLDAGQTVWWAVHKSEKPGRGKTIENTKMVPVILSIASIEDLDLRLNGYSAKEIRRFKVARLLKEAYQQDGVLNQADISQLIGVSSGTISKDIREYQVENNEVLPYRGTIHDIGPTLTHKKIIIKQFLKNVPTPEIARRTYHSEEACDRYIKSFKRVKKLYYDKIPLENIASDLEMSKNLVREYIEIIEESKNKGGKQ